MGRYGKLLRTAILVCIMSVVLAVGFMPLLAFAEPTDDTATAETATCGSLPTAAASPTGGSAPTAPAVTADANDITEVTAPEITVPEMDDAQDVDMPASEAGQVADNVEVVEQAEVDVLPAGTQLAVQKGAITQEGQAASVVEDAHGASDTASTSNTLDVKSPDSQGMGTQSTAGQGTEAPLSMADVADGNMQTQANSVEVQFIKRNWSYTRVIEETATEWAVPVPANGALTAGWYYLNSNVTVKDRIYLTGDTYLILGDNFTLNVKGLYIPKGYTLTIYGQKNDTGKLVSKPSGGAAIGGYSGHDNGSIVIHGGVIEATGYNNCAGIGSNDSRTTGPITIYGGTITATSTSNGAGIGAGRDSDGGTITIYGGRITATGKDSSAGIGGGDASGTRADNSTIEIYGGTITATGNSKGAGIGGGEYGHATINIFGGTITATGGSSGGAGIGNGVDGAGSKVTIAGGKVNATGSSGGSGIGNGKNKSNSLIVLGYKDSMRETIRVTASSFGGTVSLARPFAQISTGLLFQEGLVADNSLLAGGALTWWDGEGEDVAYVNAAGESMGTQRSVPITAAATTWSNGWYAVNGNVSINSRVQVVGTVNLILRDGCSLNATKGISLPEGSHLIIWAQSGGTGSLTATSDQKYYAGIGGYIKNGDNMATTYGSLTINGGKISATGGEGAAGIGTSYGKSGTLTIIGGEVIATGGQYASGIGAGIDPNEGTVYTHYECYLGSTNFYGGKTTVYSGKDHSGNVLKPIGAGCALTGSGDSFFLDDGMKVLHANLSQSYGKGYWSISSVWYGDNWVIVEPKIDGSVVYTITVENADEHGTVSASTAMAHAGATITVGNERDTGYELGAITVTDRNGQAVTVSNGAFTMPSSSVTVSATFRQIDYVVTVNASGHGTVTADHSTAHYGDTVTLTFTPNDEDCTLSAFAIKDAKGDNVAFDAQANSFTMPASNVTVTAVYDKTLFRITTSGDQYGAVTAPAKANIGETVTLTITPNENCRLVSITATAGGQQVAVTYNSFVMPGADVTVTAAFETSYLIDTSGISHGTVTDRQRAYAGEVITLTPTPDDGYRYVERSSSVAKEGGGLIGIDNNAFTMPASAVIVAASFEALPQTLYASLSGAQYGSYTVSVNGGEPVAVSEDNLIQINGVKTGDTITVTFSPSANGRIGTFYLEDLATHHEYHHEGDIVSHQEGDIVSCVYVFTMPAEGMEVFTRFVFFNPVQIVSYIDENGEEQTVQATVLTGFESQDFYEDNMRVVLGDDDTDTWYFVPESVTYAHGGQGFQTNLFLRGHVHLIVADGKTLNVQKGIIHNSYDGGTLSVYGQTAQTGRIASNGFTAGELNVCSGGLTVKSINNNTVNVKNGVLTVNGNVSTGNMTISGGTTKITGSVAVQGDFTLGCGDMDDRITIGAYDVSHTGTFKIADGQTLVNDAREYTGKLSVADAQSMARKTLMLAHEHNSGNLTYHAAVAPTYDPSTGTYTIGSHAHYDCSLCGGHFVEESGSLVRKTENDLIAQYFRFRRNPISGYDTYSEIIEYNGTDASIVIPDRVPADYLDADQRENIVTGIDVRAFVGKTFITDVTVGDDLHGIYESAFEGCTGLVTITAGSGLSHIGSGAFKGCASLASFSSTSTEVITFYYQAQEAEDSFDTGSGIRFCGPHGSTLLNIAKDFGGTFVPTDPHNEPQWTWATDYSCATATFDCDGTCELNGDKFTDYKIEVSEDGASYIAEVTVDGQTFANAVPRDVFTLVLMTWDGGALPVTTASGDTIDFVKGEITAMTGYPVAKQQLLDSGFEEFENGKTLAYYGIGEQSVVYLFLAPCAIVFDGNGGSGSVDTAYVAYGETFALPTATSFDAPEGKTFKEWSVKIGDAGAAGMQPGVEFAVTDDVIVTAMWEDLPPVTYTLTVVNGTGDGNYAAGQSVAIAADEPAAGKRFKEWAGAEGLAFTSGSAITATATFKMPARALTVTATYEDDPTGYYRIETREGAPAIGSDNLADVAKAVFTQDELDAGCKLLLVSSPIGESDVPEGDRRALLAKAAELGATAGAWFDISLYKMQGDSKVRLDEVPVPVRITAEVPESLRKEGRTFFFLRVHNDKVTIAAEGTGTTYIWETGEFSTYLLAFKDKEPSSSAAGNAGTTTSRGIAASVSPSSLPNTGDPLQLMAIALGATAIAFGAVAIAVASRRRRTA